MGCLNTTVKVEPLPEELTEPLPSPAAPPDTDPRLPINTRQVFKLKKNWKGIKRKLDHTGLEMFVRFVALRALEFLSGFSLVLRSSDIVYKEGCCGYDDVSRDDIFADIPTSSK